MLTGRPPAALPRLLWTHACPKLARGAPGHSRHTRALGTSVVRGEEAGGKAKQEGDGERVTGPVSTVDGVVGIGAATSEMTEDDMRRLVASLSVDQRAALMTQIHQVQAVEVKKKAEEKLASWRWRSRFGRPASLHALGPDPTGTYCEIPADWLRRKVAEKSKPKPPTGAELRQLAIHNALPFIGFGFLDNFIMIVAGDYIDVTIGTALGISTMGAAALGNTISDLAGIGSAWYVENIAVKIGIRAPDLCQEQLDRWSARWSANAGRGIGVVVGCLLGMFPLMFLPGHDEDKKAVVEH
ncbi:uncharacterized protein [Procambarus clarkii]|uniref:uncharacterized protein isoform X4 n=1 Tax=Procambarus clarkii TaxID=6728 RepID=UPI001E672796|nr:uncharacterized protein LOC123747103 isoform X2 [Procambarus clarkii]